MTTRFVNQKVREYPMTATIEYYVAIDDALAQELEANGELHDVLEYIALPNISLQSPSDADISKSVTERVKEDVVLWQLSDVNEVHAQVESDDYETVVHDENENVEDDAEAVAGATV